MSWLRKLAERSKASAAARLAAGRSRSGSKLKPKDKDSGPGPLGGSLPSAIAGGRVQVRDEGYTITYPIKAQWFQQGEKGRQPARRVIGLSKDEKAAHREAAVAELRRLGRRLGVFR